MAKVKEDLKRVAGKVFWGSTHGTYLTGQASIDGVDHLAIELERKWGVGRLRLLVEAGLREKFDRQRYLFHTACHNGELEDVRRESERMARAWQALDGAAKAGGAAELSPLVWEVTLENGSVAAIVRSAEEARAVVAEGRELVVYTLEEVAHMMAHYHEIGEVKEAFPGATVAHIRKSIDDPLDGIRVGGSFDDPLEELLTEYGA